jgi:hypothetical protein
MSRNDHTGQEIKTKPSTKAYDEGWDRIFGNKNKSTGTLEMVNKVESIFIDPLCNVCGSYLKDVLDCNKNSCPKFEET